MDSKNTLNGDSFNLVTPSSGQLIGMIVDALGTRQGVLADRQASRYFAGEVVSPERRATFINELASQLIDQEIIPSAVVRFIAQQERSPLVASVIEWHANRWDQLGSYVYARSARVSKPRDAIADYLRLVVVDLSLRIVAASWLSGAKPPGTDVPVWAKGSGLGQWLNELRKSTGLTREEFARRGGVTKQAADEWLDGDSRPRSTHLTGLASGLSNEEAEPSNLHGALTRVYFLRELGNRLAQATDRALVEHMGQSLNIIVDQLLRLHQRAFPSPDDPGWDSDSVGLAREVSRAISVIVLGSSSPGALLFLDTLTDGVEDFEWNLAARAVTLNWSLYLETQRLRNGTDSLAGDDPGKSFADEAVKDALAANAVKSIDALYRGDLKAALKGIIGGLKVSEAALESTPQDAWLHLHVGSMVGKFTDPEKGVQECRIAAELEPDWELPQVEIGVILVNAGRHEEARVHMEDLVERWPDPTWHLLYTLGESQERCGDFQAALVSYEKGLQLNGYHAVMIDRAAHCSFMLGDNGKGSQLAKRAHNLGSSDTYRRWRSGKYRKRRRRSRSTD